MSSKVLFIKYVPHLLRGDAGEQQKSLLAAATCTNSHGVLLQTSKAGCLSIQGFPDIPHTHRHNSWTLFKDAMKALVGVPQTSSICIRFAQPPCSVLTSVAEILAEPSHIVQLLATPVPHSTPLTLPPTSAVTRRPADHCKAVKRDPYCQYKERFQRPGNATSLIKRKCEYSDMQRLLTQLDEVSDSLQRTQRACDALMSKPRAAQHTSSDCSASKSKPRTVSASDSTSLFTDSGNGSSLNSAETTDGTNDDDKVEELLQVAESAILEQQQTPPPHPPSKDSTDAVVPVFESPYDDDDGVCLPDPPTGVSVQPSLTQGGVYILWNPVRLDAQDMNHGHTVLGYKVHLDKRVRACVSGGLASGAELLGNQLEEGVEYTVQVCTQTNHCNSLLSKPFLYRHCSKPPAVSGRSSRLRQESSPSKTTARVESWLLNGTMSLVSNGLSPSHRGHVHFASEEYNRKLAVSDRKWVGSDSHTLDSGCEDSSVTSGIVTDCPVSPYVKTFPCFNCPDTHSLSTNLPSASDDGFHTLTRSCDCHTPSLSNTLLSPSNRTSRAASLDTVIDEPVKGTRRHKVLYTVKQKKPAAPEALSAYLDPTDRDWIIIEWAPVSRDGRGCNNGFFILGYRVYINDTPQCSVNGAMTSRTRIACPTPHNQPIKLDVRSRAMAGESQPSHPVYFNQISRPQPHHSVRCRSAASAITMTTDTSTRTMLAQNLRVETYV